MSKSGAASSSGHQRGVLIEADLVVLPGMEIFLESCTARLAKEGIKLKRDMFLRFLFGKLPARGMAALLEKSGKAGEASVLAAECTAAYLEALQAAVSKVRDGVLTFAQDVASRGVKVGLITQLPEEAAKQVFASVMGSHVVTITETPHHLGLHGWEGWRRAARKLQVGERLCLAISSPASARGALAAAMRVAVVQDPMQDHFDCGGVDLLVESFTPAVRTSALGLLKIED
jgi:beta-phosphoglucomutase-like phosphatase (HAD superfamily)